MIGARPVSFSFCRWSACVFENNAFKGLFGDHIYFYLKFTQSYTKFSFKIEESR